MFRPHRWLSFNPSLIVDSSTYGSSMISIICIVAGSGWCFGLLVDGASDTEAALGWFKVEIIMLSLFPFFSSDTSYLESVPCLVK